MDLYLLKFILLIIMIIATLVAGLLPLKVLRFLRHSAAHAQSSKDHKHVSLILCLLTCFSGGVFLATCFLHLFPELVENIEKLNREYQVHVDYPVAELLSCIGFFLLFFLEEVVILCLPSFAHTHGHTHGHGNHESLPLTDDGCCMVGGFPEQKPSKTDQHKSSHSLNAVDETRACLDKETESEDVAGHCQKHCPLTVHLVRRPSGRDSPNCSAPAEVFTALALAEPERCETNCEKVDEFPPILMKSSPHAHSHGVRSITFVLALSIHSVIEGLALGVGDNASETTALFLSLLVHKVIVAFSVGLQLARTHAHQLRWVVLSVFILACMSPIGALIGMIVQSATIDSLGKEVVITVMQGLAVGTFLYVTFFEVLLHERDNEHPNLLKLLVMVIGFSLIGLLRLMDNHDHSGVDASLSNHTLLLHDSPAAVAHFGHSHD